MQLTTSWKEEGIIEGLERGRQQEGRQLVLRQLRCRLTNLPAGLMAQLQALTIEEIENLAGPSWTSPRPRIWKSGWAIDGKRPDSGRQS
jgi:hypothetical protein